MYCIFLVAMLCFVGGRGGSEGGVGGGTVQFA